MGQQSEPPRLYPRNFLCSDVDRQQGKLPTLGWNSWNMYGCNIDEAKFLSSAQEFVKLGLKDAGYQYINSLSAPQPTNNHSCGIRCGRI